MPTLYLIFNHRLTAEQESDARKKLGVSDFVYLPDELQKFWSQIPPDGELNLTSLKPIVSWLERNAASEDYVLLQGDFGVTYYMVGWCIAHGLTPVYATTRRDVEERRGADDRVEKKVVFRHVGFRRYITYKEN